MRAWSRYLLTALTSVGLLAGVGLTATPAQATVSDPNATVAGANTKWFSGSLLTMWGLNCSTAILGSSYNEIMIQGYATYGGAPSGGAPKVNETYYAVINLSEPGFPCGTGISIPDLRLRLPANTQLAIDAQHPIRCFVTPRFQSVYDETTNAGNWRIDAIKDNNGNPLTGPWCRQNPIQIDQFTYSIGTPAMANGTMHKVFVPIRSTNTISNQALQWEVRDPVTYEGMQLSEARVWVFPTNLNQASPNFFFPDRAAVAYWDAKAAAGQQSKVEFFMNLYTGGQAGKLCYQIRFKNDQSLAADCTDDPSLDGTVQAGEGVVQLLMPSNSPVRGPNGGYAPFYFNQPFWDTEFQIQWTFKNNSNQLITASPWIDFRTLAGPDGDGDGVIDSQDKCATTPGTKADGGCPPSLPADTDGDGAVGVQDKCPNLPGNGSLDGCPASPAPPAPAPVITTMKTVKVPGKLVGAKKLKSLTPKVCKITGKGKKAKVSVLKSGKCKLTGKKGKKKVKASFRVNK